MNKERELLRRALEDWDVSDKFETLDPIFEEIRTYLSTPSDDAEEPVAWGYKDRWGDISDCISCQSAKDAGTKGDFTIPLYLHPPKPAEQEAETIETLKAENFALASGQCTEGGPWGDEGGTPYCKYAKRKPMTEEEAIELCPFTREEFKAGFLTGVRYAEKHHGIGESNDTRTPDE